MIVLSGAFGHNRKAELIRSLGGKMKRIRIHRGWLRSTDVNWKQIASITVQQAITCSYAASTDASLGGAIVGGLFWGWPGAIVGGLIGSGRKIVAERTFVVGYVVQVRLTDGKEFTCSCSTGEYEAVCKRMG